MFGAGAIGCWIGGRLAAGGCDVTLVGRTRVLDELRGGLTTSELHAGLAQALRAVGAVYSSLSSFSRSECRSVMIKQTHLRWIALSLLASGGAFGQSRGNLTVKILEGDGAFNDIKHKVGHPLGVEVRDQNNRVVSGAEVVNGARLIPIPPIPPRAQGA